MEQALEKLAKVEHLLLRNSGNSSMPPSKDDDSGRTPPRKERRAKPPGRAKGKQRGAPGTALRWREEDGLDDRLDRYPMGARDCGADLAEATDPGVVDHYQQHEIPLVSVTVTQYDQHAVACGCGQVHTANFSGRPKVSLDGGIEEFPEFRPRRRSSSAPPGGQPLVGHREFFRPRLCGRHLPLEQPDQREEILTRRRPQSGRHDHGSCRTHPAPVTSSGGRRTTDLLNAYTRSG